MTDEAEPAVDALTSELTGELVGELTLLAGMLALLPDVGLAAEAEVSIDTVMPLLSGMDVVIVEPPVALPVAASVTETFVSTVAAPESIPDTLALAVLTAEAPTGTGTTVKPEVLKVNDGKPKVGMMGTTYVPEGPVIVEAVITDPVVVAATRVVDPLSVFVVAMTDGDAPESETATADEALARMLETCEFKDSTVALLVAVAVTLATLALSEAERLERAADASIEAVEAAAPVGDGSVTCETMELTTLEATAAAEETMLAAASVAAGSVGTGNGTGYTYVVVLSE